MQFHLINMNDIHTGNRFVWLTVLFTFLQAGTVHGACLVSPIGAHDASYPSPWVLHTADRIKPPASTEKSAQYAGGEPVMKENPDTPLQDSVKPAEMPEDSDYFGTDEEAVTIADPLEPFNRAMFHFNDRFYFWLLKPVSQGYGAVVPEKARVCVNNFFSNLRFPIRFVSSLLQADLIRAATELGRFGINTTVGIAGFFDPASSQVFELQKQDTDLGLTLASYGLGHGFYIDWPILGPSSPRDTLGTTGDYFLYPVSYIPVWYVSLGVRGYEEVNSTSLKIGDYESLKEAAIDPYVALRDAYVQYRHKKGMESSRNKNL
jgi:phospholipid-binding lipoprotein MlaA